MQSVVLSGKTIPYRIVHSSRAKQLSLKISPRTGLVLVVPNRLSIDHLDVNRLLTAKRNWILNKIRLIDREKSIEPRLRFLDGSKLPLLGKDLILRIVHSQKGLSRIVPANGELIITTPQTEEDGVKAVVVRWLLHQARRIIPARVHKLNEPLGFPLNNITVKDQKSRWGSCSRKGNLNFNWRLLVIPPHVMDYLIYHELAHLEEPNHSIHFWRLVKRLCPGFHDAEMWLKHEGREYFH